MYLSGGAPVPVVTASSYKLSPTGGLLVQGTEQQITSQTAAAAEGVNTGSWKGTLADDDFHWMVSSSSSTGLDVRLDLDGAELNGANKLLIQTELDTDANINAVVQICDWVSVTSVSNAADATCTGGGWRTLNTRNASQAAIGITATTALPLQWHIYDGYWSSGTTGGTPVSTPLSNFVTTDANKKIKIRYFSTTLTATPVAIDYLRATAIIDSVYSPASFTNLGSGAPVGQYNSTGVVGNTASAQMLDSDDIKVNVPGTALTPSDFYFSYKNVQTYPGMNTIMVRAEYSCSLIGINHRPKIWNFTSSAWEDLTSASIACALGDASDTWAKNNVNVSNYISGGEMRVGWRGLGNGIQEIQIDYMYVMLGSTNDDSTKCEISFGTGTSTNCTSTRDMDSQVSPNGVNMAITAEDQSAAMGTGEANSYYPFDVDNDVSALEEGAAANVFMPVSVPTGTALVGLNYASRFAGRSAGVTAVAGLGIKDFSGLNDPATGSWSAIGATSAAAAHTYTDSVTALSASTYGYQSNPEDYANTTDGLVNLRLRNTVDSASVDNNVLNWDFAMVSLQWINAAAHPSQQSQFTPTSQSLVVGTAQTATSQTAAATEGVNTGSWKGTLADDNFHWTVAGAGVAPTGTNFDVQLNMDGVRLAGGNKLLIQTEVDIDATVPNLKFQICDWVSSTSVDNAADAQCTGGGWRTVNTRNAANAVVAYTSATPNQMQWHIYDGYWSTGTTGGTPVSTPLRNFISSDTNRRVKIRYFDNSVNTTSVLSIDFLRVSPIVDSVYEPAAVTNLGTGTPTGTYTNAQYVSNLASGQSTITNNATSVDVPGTLTSVSDFYLTYKNVKTYPGMNTILLKADYRCSGATNTHRPKIWNFTSSAWEDLTTNSIACSITDATNSWAKSNVTVANYISNGEVRIGWRTLANGTDAIRLDFAYIMLGSTNSDSAKCEISFGTGTATNCTNTRTMDTLAAASSLAVTAEDQSATMGTGEANSYYPFDIDNDATALEEGAAANITMSASVPVSTSVVGLHYSANFAGRSAGTTAVAGLGIKDFSGLNNPSTGSWAALGGTSATATQTYSDSLTALTTSVYGHQQNPNDYISGVADTVNFRIRNTVDSASLDNNVLNWDFAMTSLQWVSAPAYEQRTYRWFANADSTNVGSPLATQNVAAVAPTQGTPFRLRMLIGVNSADLAISGENFKLQLATKSGGTCDTDEVYNDLSSGSGAIRYFNNTPADGVALTANANDPASGTTIAQTYEEANNFTNSIAAVSAGQNGLWDFALVDNSSPSATSYCIRAVKSDNAVLTTYSVTPEITTAANTAPNSPATLLQKKTTDEIIATGAWITNTSVKFTADASDTVLSDQVALCVEKKPVGTVFANTEDACGTLVNYAGTPVAVSVTLNSITDATEYHWQARVKDSGGLYSGWVSYGGNAESARDFGIDSTAPTGGTVYDGTSAGVDGSFNTGSLTTLSANWSGIDSSASGVAGYEYSIGTASGGITVKGWTSNGTSTSVTDTILSLQTSQKYYVNVRTTDTAGNVSTPISSNGQLVAPTVSFSVSPSVIAFSRLNNANSHTDTKTSTLTTSTNAYGGYVVRSYIADLLRAQDNNTIGLFDGGSYASPAAWQGSNTGFGYTSDDSDIQGVNKFSPATCPGGGSPPCFAPFSLTTPGEIVADHTTNVVGTPITNQSFILTFKVQTTAVQPANNYNTVTVYSITPIY